MADGISHALWLRRTEEARRFPILAVVILTMFFGLLYLGFGACIILEIVYPKRPHPQGLFRLPRCFSHGYLRHLRYPLVFVGPGLLWPFFLAFVYLRWKLDERRERNDDHELQDLGGNEGAVPPPARPTFFQLLNE